MISDIHKAPILVNGEPLTVSELHSLGLLVQQAVQDKVDAARYRKLRVKNWSEGGITVVAKAGSVKLGHECLSHERLDGALDKELPNVLTLPTDEVLTTPTDDEIISCILQHVFIRGIDLTCYQREFTEERSGLPSAIRRLFTT